MSIMTETNINWVCVTTVEIKNTKFYYWNHIVDALDIHDFSPKYYKCDEVLLKEHPNMKFISEENMLKLCREKLGELELLPGVVVPKKK
jgi:hypothetical protein